MDLDEAGGGAAPRRVFLLRHAKSSWHDDDVADFDRPLAPRGERAVEKLRNHMSKTGVAPALVLCSAAKRTRQTLAGVAAAFEDDVAVSVERGLYLLDLAGWLRRLRQIPETVTSVMAIGHNPGLQALALKLAGRGDATLLTRLGMKFPSGGLATLTCGGTWPSIGAGACELEAFVVPKEL